MRAIHCFPIVLLLGGCASLTQPVEEPTTAADSPILFDYAGLDPAQGTYKRLHDARGAIVNIMMLSGPGGVAAFQYVAISGDYYVIPPDMQDIAGRVIKGSLDWGAAGELGTGTETTRYQLFQPQSGELHCVALQRSLKEHTEEPAGNFSQGIVTGVFCEKPNLPETEVPAVAAALRSR